MGHPGGYLDGGRKPTSLHVVARDLIGRVTATWSGVVYRKRAWVEPNIAWDMHAYFA